MTVERHGDHFAPDCPDSDWLAAVSAKGWIALTHDKRIRYKPNELAAVVATSPDVLKFIAAHQPPYIAKVYRPSPAAVSADPLATGRVELWYPK